MLYSCTHMAAVGAKWLKGMGGVKKKIEIKEKGTKRQKDRRREGMMEK